MPENKLYLLSKCVERRYAEKLFYDGILHFGYPSVWIEKAKPAKIGQADPWEGVYSNEITPENLDKRECVDDPTIEGVQYLRSQKVANWPCYCLYSVCDQTPHEWEEDAMVFDMSEAYAQDFANGETWKTRFDTTFENRKAMVVIHRPEVFLKKVKDFFTEKGLVEGCDYYMGCVHYRKGGKFTYKKAPEELFYKDARFEKQQEFRIALNPESQKTESLLDEHQNVSIGGSLEDCAMLKSHFYRGARILVKGDEVWLEVRGWSNLSGPLHEIELVPLLNLLGITFMDTAFQIDGREVRGDELRMEVAKVLLAKYRNVYHMEFPAKPVIHFSYWSDEEIKKNEEKDSYFFLKRYKGGETPFLEKMKVFDADGVKEYSDLVYDVDGVIVPLLREHLSGEEI